MTVTDQNLAIYNAPEVVAHYAKAEGLQGCEVYAFGKYIPAGSAILDLGVGGGRTVAALAANASHYIGVDYAQSMVDVCKARFPGVEFDCESACDLSRYGDAMFDVVVFSFNGLGYIRTDAERATALSEIARVLKPGGTFIFSLHNAKAVGLWPIMDGADMAHRVWRVARAAGRSVWLFAGRIGTTTYRTGAGYVHDRDMGGLNIFLCTPETITPELSAAGFAMQEVINGLYPRRIHAGFTPWYYYVLSKAKAWGE